MQKCQHQTQFHFYTIWQIFWCCRVNLSNTVLIFYQMNIHKKRPSTNVATSSFMVFVECTLCICVYTSSWETVSLLLVRNKANTILMVGYPWLLPSISSFQWIGEIDFFVQLKQSAWENILLQVVFQQIPSFIYSQFRRGCECTFQLHMPTRTEAQTHVFFEDAHDAL